MFNTYEVHLPSGITSLINCQPGELKRKISNELIQLPFEQLILINQKNGQLLNSYDLRNQGEIILQAMDLNLLLKENLMLKGLKEMQGRKIQQLERDIEQCRYEISLQEQERATIINDSQAENISLGKALNEIQQLLQNKSINLDQMEKQLNISNQQNQECQDRLKVLQGNSQKKDDEILQQKNCIQNLHLKIQSYDQQFEAYQQNYIQMKMEQDVKDNQIQQQQFAIKKLEGQIIEQKSKVIDLEEENEVSKANFNKEKQEKESLTTQLKDMKVKCQELEESIENLTKTSQDQIYIQQLKKDLKQQTQNNQEMKIQFEQSIALERQQFHDFFLNKKKEYQQEIQNIEEKLEKQRLDFDIQLKKEQEEVRNLQNDKKQIEREKQSFQIEIENFKKSLQDNNNQIVLKQYNNKKLEEQNQESLQIIQNKNQTIAQQSQTIVQLNQTIAQLEISNLEIQNQLQQLQEKEIAFNQYLNQQKIQIEKEGKTVINYENKLKVLSQRLEDVQRIEKYSSPMEELMKTEFKINNFFEDPNSQLDEQVYNLYEVDYDENKFSNYIQQEQYFQLDSCFRFQHLGRVSCTRSIQPNVQTDLFKCYLIKIKDSFIVKDLKDKIIMRKDLKFSTSQCSTLNQAAKNATNNIFTKWLLKKFNNDMPNAQLKVQNNIQIQRQFILENKEKQEFYYCEKVENGTYQKINGGQFAPQEDELHQYLNEFSRYSLKYFDDNIIITYLQVCGDYLHDMIVSTKIKGLFSLLDKGQEEIITFKDIVEKGNKDTIKGGNDILGQPTKNQY